LREAPPEGAILVDAGTTTAQLAQRLPAGRELTVVTNSLLTGLAPAGRSGLTMLTLGGRVRGRTFAAVDAWALYALGQIVVNVAFIGANGISVERGWTTLDPAEAEVERMMISRARRAIVLADHSKFERDQLVRFGELDDVELVISDTGLNRSFADRIHESGGRLMLA
jgi:DeoR family transcriptional regulator, fructose operon transcriptional repressor